MWGWQGVLALLVVAWLLQCIGTVIQIKRYRAAFRELSTGWSDGWMGVGKAGKVFQPGVIAMIVVAPDDTVRRVVTIKGRTVFAKAQRNMRFEDRSVAQVRAEMEGSGPGPESQALLAALDQVATVRRGKLAKRQTQASTVPATA